jgi:hypothetical protein
MKGLSIILILSLLHYYLGCYSTKTLKNQPACQYTLKESDPIYVKTKDRITYFYAPGTYKFENDTLYGYGQKLIWNEKQAPEPVKIACGDITQIEVRKDNTGKTLIAVYFVLTIVIIVAFAITFSDWKNWGEK